VVEGLGGGVAGEGGLAYAASAFQYHGGGVGGESPPGGGNRGDRPHL